MATLTTTREEQLSKLLLLAAEGLDIPEQQYQDAVLKYRQVGQWLKAADSPLYWNSPDIYPQGSFLLGTIVRPITERDEYDIDLVSMLQLKKESISQHELKKRIGDRLKQSERYRKVLREGRRCWTLDFETRFHMDVLPAIPDEEGLYGSILITDKELTRWQHSNPNGYATWFRDRMKVIFEQEKRALAKALQANIEDVPDWKVKTPLQRSIQLLKRHRDLYFQDDKEDRPVSIIISTLAAWAYMRQANLYDALVHIVRTMPDHIEERDGAYWVANPINSSENFADKWQQHPQRREKFFSWLDKVQIDLKAALETRGLHEITAALGSGFGQSVMEKAVKRLGNEVYQERQGGKLFMAAGTGTLGSSGTTSVRGHTFYGGVPKAEND